MICRFYYKSHRTSSKGSIGPYIVHIYIYMCVTFSRIGQGGHLCFRSARKITNLVDDVDILLPVKFVEFSSAVSEERVKNVLAYQRPGRPCYSYYVIFYKNCWETLKVSTFFLKKTLKKSQNNFESCVVFFFSSPETKAQVSYCHSAPSVVVVVVVVRKLSHFRLLLWNRWTEFNETWQEARSQRPLRSLCFSGRSEKQDGRPGLWLAETFSTSPLKPLNGFQRNLTGSKILTPSTKFVFFRPIGKTRWPPWPLIGLDIFDFSSETAKRNSTKLDRKQDLNALYQVCVFRADRKNKMAVLAYDWLRHFRLLLWNRWTEFNETWQEARSQRSLPSLCFSGRSEKQDGRPGLWLAETFSTSPLKPLNGFQRNLTGSNISTTSTKFVIFGPIGKTRWSPWPLIGWDIFDFSSETAERNSTKLDRKQVLNVLYQVCVFRADPKNNMASVWLRHILTFPLKLLNGIQRNLTGSKILTSSTKFVFFGPKSE